VRPVVSRRNDWTSEDQAQLDYDREITKRVPGALLRRRGMIDYQNGAHSTSGLHEMTAAERHEIIALRHAKVFEFRESDRTYGRIGAKLRGYVSGAPSATRS
jgi:hypothetical protein